MEKSEKIAKGDQDQAGDKKAEMKQWGSLC